MHVRLWGNDNGYGYFVVRGIVQVNEGIMVDLLLIVMQKLSRVYCVLLDLVCEQGLENYRDLKRGDKIVLVSVLDRFIIGNFVDEDFVRDEKVHS